MWAHFGGALEHRVRLAHLDVVRRERGARTRTAAPGFVRMKGGSAHGTRERYPAIPERATAPEAYKRAMTRPGSGYGAPLRGSSVLTGMHKDILITSRHGN